jgi:hypothetical protein
VRVVPKIGKYEGTYRGNEQDILKDHFSPPVPSLISQKRCFIIHVHLSVLHSCNSKRAPLSLSAIDILNRDRRMIPNFYHSLHSLSRLRLNYGLETGFVSSQPDAGRSKKFQLISVRNFLISSRRRLGTSKGFPFLLTHAGSRSSKLRKKVMEQLRVLLITISEMSPIIMLVI